MKLEILKHRLPEPEGAWQELQELRDALLHLHKVLIESERVGYEKTVGTIQSPNHFFQLLTSDPWFAWLHPLSEVIVQLDELLDESDEFEPDEAAKILAQVRAFITGARDAGEPGRRYQAALQNHPDVVIEHGRVTKAME